MVGPEKEMYRLTECTSDLRPGGKWSSVGVGADGTSFRVDGEYLEIDPPRLLVQTWIPSWSTSIKTVVRWELEPADVHGLQASGPRRTGRGTLVKIRQEGFAGLLRPPPTTPRDGSAFSDGCTATSRRAKRSTRGLPKTTEGSGANVRGFSPTQIAGKSARIRGHPRLKASMYASLARPPPILLIAGSIQYEKPSSALRRLLFFNLTRTKPSQLRVPECAAACRPRAA
jgi:hypothetical protein